MQNFSRLAATLGLLLALGGLTVLAGLGAQRGGSGDEMSPGERFLSALKRAVDQTDRRGVASMVAYPATVLAGGFNIPVKDAATFVTMYKAVFTPELRCAVVRSEMTKPGGLRPRHAVTESPDGLVIADGAIWAPLKGGRFRIARITVPPAAPTMAGRIGTERVTFPEARGERSASFAGWLVRQNVDAYVVAVKKGETLLARIEGFSGHDATVRVSAYGRESGHCPAAGFGTRELRDGGL